MPRSVNSVASRARRKKVLKQTKGYFGSRKNVFTVAKNTLDKGLGMHTATEEKRKDSSEHCGFRGSMQVFASMI